MAAIFMDHTMQEENQHEAPIETESVNIGAPNVADIASPSEAPTPEADTPTEEVQEEPGTPSEAAQETTDEKDAPSDDDKPKKKNRAKERIDRLTAEKYQAIAEAKAHAQEVARLRERLGEKPELAEDDFEGHQAHQVRQMLNEDRLRDAEDAAMAAEQKRLATMRETFIAKLEAADHLPADTFDKFSSVPVAPASAEFIADSDKAAELANWLGSNPHEARRIASLPMASQISALARQEAKISSAPTARKVSQAPPRR